MTQFAGLIACVSVLALGASCSSADSDAQPEGDPIPSSTATAVAGGPRLLVSTIMPGADPIGRDANVTGKLSLNEKDCYQLGDSILVAPYGSNIVDGGKAVELTGYGRFELGDRIKGGGGYMPAALPEVDPAWRDCIVNKKRDYFVFPNDLPR